MFVSDDGRREFTPDKPGPSRIKKPVRAFDRAPSSPNEGPSGEQVLKTSKGN